MRTRTSLVLALAALLALAPAARAEESTYDVTGKGDAPGAGCVSAQPHEYTCDSLRAAVNDANLDVGGDLVYLRTPGTYTLTQGPLDIESNLSIIGLAPVNTTLKGNGTSRVLTVATNMDAQLTSLTVSGGVAGGGLGGNILNRGALLLQSARVTGGTAQSGGGVASLAGYLVVNDSLVDHNTATGGSAYGGGILAEPDPDDSLSGAGSVLLTDSTVALNTVVGDGAGAGVSLRNNASNFLQVLASTIARNAVSGAGGGGAGVDNATDPGRIETMGSLYAGNTSGGALRNCGGDAPAETQPGNVEDGTTCSLAQGNLGGFALDDQLTDQGGPTPVLAFPGSSSLKGRANPCLSSVDQRGGERPGSGPCDPGAYEQGVQVDPITPLDPGDTPPPDATPTPPVVTPAATPVATRTATPTPPPAPAPEFHKDVVVKPVSGTVKVKLKGTNTFVDLAAAKDIPLGSTIDVKAGRIELSSVPKKGGTPQTAVFYGGIFKISQPGQITDLQLDEPLAACPKRGKASAAARKKPKTRSLWGQGHGAFRTSGSYSAATVRGTQWFVQDSCAGTLTRVVQGVVNVRDDVRHKTIVVRAGHRYLAKPRH